MKRMKMKGILVLFGVGVLLTSNVYAQNNVGIGTNTPDASAVLDVESTTQGMLVPRLTTAQRTAIAAPANGLLVYDVTVGCFFYYDTPNTTWQNLCAATGGSNGISCWDLNGNGINDPAEDVNGDLAWDALDCQGADGAPGVAGAAGAAGTPGTDGVSCWDLNGDGVNDPAEDVNGDLVWDALDCQGADGATGPQGPAGPAGTAGTAGTTGATGPQGPSGVINRYHVYGTSGRLAVSSATHTVQPGMTQTFTLTAPANVIIWATIGARTTGTTSGSYALVDMIVYLNGNFLPSGGWNRFSVVNPTSTNSFNTCAINTMVSLPAGTHTIDLRTARQNGNVTVDIGGNATTDVNPGELTILILN
jgi:hypothetical protein